ncbi:MAG TPA: hypothetical protein ENK43_13535 [Planctomycetes bacterium]|nr:hypothetical protein [Planctomycetota bacterium]
MSRQHLEDDYRIALIEFLDDERHASWSNRLSDRRSEVIGLVSHVLGGDLGIPPEDLDGQHVAQLMATFLPGRLGGKEPYVSDLPDMMEAFMAFLAEASGVAKAWEWTSAVVAGRDAFEHAMANPDRPRFAPRPKEPDRRPAAKIGRNDPCPCGSGKKYKRCCLRLL